MALLRKCLNDVRTRGLSREFLASVFAGAPDTVMPPPDARDAPRVLACTSRVPPAHPPQRSRAAQPAFND